MNRLTTRHYLWIADHIVGKTNAEIAVRYGVKTATVTACLGTAIAQAEIIAMRQRVLSKVEDIGAQIQALRPQAVQVLKNTLNSLNTDHHTEDRKTKVALEILRGPGGLEPPVDTNEKKAGVRVKITKTAQDIGGDGEFEVEVQAGASG